MMSVQYFTASGVAAGAASAVGAASAAGAASGVLLFVLLLLLLLQAATRRASEGRRVFRMAGILGEAVVIRNYLPPYRAKRTANSGHKAYWNTCVLVFVQYT
jgi:hypothetical protein